MIWISNHTRLEYIYQSGLSQASGITASGNGIDIGGAMIAVTIGITVGLFMNQAPLDQEKTLQYSLSSYM